MPISNVVAVLDRAGLPSTVELPWGKWGHSEEYFALRYSGMKGLVGLLRGRLASPNNSERSGAAVALERLGALRDEELLALVEAEAPEDTSDE